MARPGGGFTVCFGDLPDPRTTTTVVGCSFTSARGRFGPMRVVERRPSRQRMTFQAAMRSDGKVVLVLSHRLDGGRQKLRSTTLNARGTRGPLRSLTTIGRQSEFSLATTDDGAAAVAWATPPTRDPRGKWALSLRLTAPGRDEFGASLPFLADGMVRPGNTVRLQGGQELRMFVSDSTDDFSGDLIVRRLPDGTFSVPLRFPRPDRGALLGSVVTLADGSPLGISVAVREDEPYCWDLAAGTVGSSPLVADASPSGSVQRLTRPGQIGFAPAAVTLADGTVIASWHTLVQSSGSTRVEVAMRTAHASAFGPPQALPQLAATESVLAAGGDRAVLVWVVGVLSDGPSHVVTSGLRQEPPYAQPGRRPKRPSTVC